MDNGHIEIAISLMKEILYDNGYIDRFHSENSQISIKWKNKIASIAGKFFDNHPELLTNENIENIASGGIENDPDEDLNIIYKDYHDIKPLLDILKLYHEYGCGVLNNSK